MPQLKKFKTENEFCRYFKKEYCLREVETFDGIRVYFREKRFNHAFYESSKKDGGKGAFSLVRAQRVDWIRITLESSKSEMFQGWDSAKKRYDPCRRVSVLYEDFIVVIEMRLKKTGELKAEFITCFQADNSIEKIRRSPKRTKQRCLEVLKKKGR